VTSRKLHDISHAVQGFPVYVHLKRRGALFVVALYVMHDFFNQLVFGSPDSASNNVTSQDAEPDFDLIEPGSICGSVVDG